MRDALDAIYHDEQFLALFPSRGKPAVPPRLFRTVPAPRGLGGTVHARPLPGGCSRHRRLDLGRSAPCFSCAGTLASGALDAAAGLTG
jgi:hypothetical protein